MNFYVRFLFCSGPYTIQGRRVQVYQPEFEEPWALGLVSHHDPVSHIMEITMDQVCDNGYVLSTTVMIFSYGFCT